MKCIGLILCLAVTGCGVGSDPEPKTMSVRLDAGTVLPSPFVVGPSGTAPTPAGPVVTFVIGPVTGPIAIVSPPIITTTPNTYPINWCTDGFIVGPCIPLPKTCQPDSSGFVTGPCP